MKLFLFLISQVLSVFLFGQFVKLDNTWQLGSNTIYVGLDNIVLIRGKIGDIISIKSDNLSLSRSNDTLIARPRGKGASKIYIEAQGQSTTVEFKSDMLPDPALIITEEIPEDTRIVMKNAILKTNPIRLISSGNSDVKLFEDYEIYETTLIIDNNSYTSKGNVLSNETKEAISISAAGTIIHIGEIKSINKATGKDLKLRTNQTLKIL